MNCIKYIFIILTLVGAIACSKDDVMMEEFRQTGGIEIVDLFPGHGRVKCTYRVMDTKVKVITVSWKQPKDTAVTIIIPEYEPSKVLELLIGSKNELPEGALELTFMTENTSGHQSNGMVKNATIYGENYISQLKNRAIRNQDYQADKYLIWFEQAVDKTDIGVSLSWKDNSGASQTIRVEGEQSNKWIELDNVDLDQPITYNTLYKPVNNAIDEFYAPVAVVDIDEDEIPGVKVPKYNANRLFIKHGLQLSVWTGDEYDPNDGWSYTVSQTDWNILGFNSCHGFQSELLAANPQMQWGRKLAPYSGHLYKGEGEPVLPTDYEKQNGFLEAKKRPYTSQMTNIIFGDEEDYSTILVDQLDQWYQVARTHYPDALVQNNQYGPQWTFQQLKDYAQKCKPDVLTYDTYFLSDENYSIFISGTARRLSKYRSVALWGLEGNRDNIPAFGQYTQGWLNGFNITESQLRAYYWMTWVYGGKWQSFFRLKQRDGDSMLLTDGNPGSYNDYTDIIVACNKESQNIGKHLVRLQTSNISLINGSSPYTYGVSSVDAKDWSSATDDYISAIDNVINNTNVKGDLFIGYYNIISAEKSGDPGFFENSDDQFFMIMNPVNDNKKILDAVENAQLVTVTIDFTNYSGKKLKMVERATGNVVKLSGEDMGDNKVKYTLTIPGGTGELMCLGY
ncbi:MAG: hypothetical protein JEZ14_18655 [Marinilabiliaceae bacterium]|nr:hypothetical protein [Marinilabiliaceae bacterium]